MFATAQTMREPQNKTFTVPCSKRECCIAARDNSDNITACFVQLIRTRRYTGYHDLTEPMIEVAENGDIGWAIGKAFDDQWAWIMLVPKIDGVWINAGNASKLKQK